MRHLTQSTVLISLHASLFPVPCSLSLFHRRRADIQKTKERMVKARGVRQPFRSGHSWDTPSNAYAFATSAKVVKMVVGEEELEGMEEGMEGGGMEEGWLEEEDMLGGAAYASKEQDYVHDDEGYTGGRGGSNDKLDQVIAMEPFLAKLLRK